MIVAPWSPVCWCNIDGLFRRRIDPIYLAFSDREHQRVKAALVQYADFKIDARWCN